MSSEWNTDPEGEQDVYGQMWENDEAGWGLNLPSQVDEWAALNDPIEDHSIPVERPSSSTQLASDGASGLLPSIFADQNATRSSSARPHDLHMGSASSSAANTTTTQPHGTHSAAANRTRALTADHREDWLDREAARGNTRFGLIPESFFETLEEDSDDFDSDGYDIDDFLEDSTSEQAAETMPHRRQTQDTYVDLTNDASSPPQSAQAPRSLKRTAEAASQSRPSKRSKREPDDTNIEELDLTNEAPSAEEELLQTQREQAIMAQQQTEESSGPLKIGQRQCIICMEKFTNATITSCGHIYCHECLTQALNAGEKNSDRGVGNCPVCRKPVSRKKANQVISISFMKKGTFKGKRRRDMAVLS